MWKDELNTVQTWVNGGEVVLKKKRKMYSFRFPNDPENGIKGLPDGMVWADTQALFEDSMEKRMKESHQAYFHPFMQRTKTEETSGRSL